MLYFGTKIDLAGVVPLSISNVIFMQFKFSVFLFGLTFMALANGAMAQTTAPATPAPTTAEAPKNKVATDKVLPFAEFYEGGQTALYDFIAKELVYPPMAKRNRVMGQVIVGFTMNEDGTVANTKILKNIGGGCGEEALRVVKLLKFKAPGFASNYSIPINFKL
ncbi:MAG: Ferric siderophore transport system, periplasmic binding protein TonB [uncultured Adhaeribacter sp.]|uniref:Ferric siderophore transport system, periplasmic binding protein TonB n=1 Tax=uncultured Adhaeribacter sp. TaxID=448109 RepID=A0A6J4HW07_9BACT|nr:MAG: Ferric siderophore transport system, periplasmic binding protein TonB [uncultured Adhaeribacter sp.]